MRSFSAATVQSEHCDWDTGGLTPLTSRLLNPFKHQSNSPSSKRGFHLGFEEFLKTCFIFSTLRPNYLLTRARGQFWSSAKTKLRLTPKIIIGNTWESTTHVDIIKDKDDNWENAFDLLLTADSNMKHLESVFGFCTFWLHTEVEFYSEAAFLNQASGLYL